ncbi:MAG: tRNA (adenosine(37)-N6)-threonylcarbamoyltransferase complex dimerization subunit type 1 TsaB [Cytophagales bacterium]|nr:tRNA (adenosine(37)-N6)-threonylcarbamoyltransferase complex dimerization subunit type 1 TsaB [Cytophagales bacterium]
MALILSIETSSTICSAALHEKGRLVASREILVPFSAASQLTPMIDELFTSAQVRKETLQAVAISGGPGSYTGLRIGISTAKGICYALGLPLVALDSLHSLACSVETSPDDSLLCPMIDARRMEVYCTLLTPAFNVLEETQAKVIDAESFSGWLEKQRIFFFGNGAAKCSTVIHHPHAVFLDSIDARAADMGGLAYRKYEAGTFAELSSFEPAYLKEFVAKTKKT